VTSTVLALVLISAFLHAAWSASIKGSRSPLAFNVTQTLVTLPFAGLGLLSVDRETFSPQLMACAVGTGVSHGLYLYWLSRALARADLTLAYPIIRSTPALLPLLAVPFLGEIPSPLGALGIGVVVSGIWLVHGRACASTAHFRAALRLAHAAGDRRLLAQRQGGHGHPRRGRRGPLPPPVWYRDLPRARGVRPARAGSAARAR
jgi:uncharacterized membrane protein